MIVRRPLTPCSSASHSIARSQTCQNGLAHLPATNAKSIAWMPLPSIRFTNRCPSTSTRSSTPEPRMNSQLFSSKLPVREARLRGRTIGGAVGVVTSASEHVRQVPDGERHEQHDPEPEHAVRELALVAGTLLPEVHQDDPDAVE